jgi:hypothetical protein
MLTANATAAPSILTKYLSPTPRSSPHLAGKIPGSSEIKPFLL